MAKRLVARTAGVAPSALDELLTAEQQIAARNAEVASECAALIDTARADAEAGARDAAAALERELEAARAAANAQRADLVRDVEAEAARTIARYRGLTDADIDRLAELIAARVTGLALPVAEGSVT